jgi:hypothetical protein
MKLPSFPVQNSAARRSYRDRARHCMAALFLTTAAAWSQTSDSAAVIDTARTPTHLAPAVDSTLLKAVAPEVAAPSLPDVAPEKPRAKLKEAYSLHPLTSLLVMGFSLSYERFLRPGVSLDIPVFLGLADKLYDQGRFYIGSGVGFRFYLRNDQEGGYLSPTVQCLNATYFEDKTADQNTPGGNVFSVMGGVRYGYKWLWEHFTIDAGLGLYGLRSFGGSVTRIEPRDQAALFPMSHFALGIPF